MLMQFVLNFRPSSVHWATNKMFAVLMLQMSSSYIFSQEHKYSISSTLFGNMMARPMLFTMSQRECVNGSFQIADTIFDSCASILELWQAGTGGAVFAQNADVTVERCAFNNNAAQYGGAMVTVGSSTTIMGSKFTGNTAISDVGALWSIVIEEQTSTPQNQLILQEGNFTNNRARDYYGAVCSNFTHPTIQYCHFDGNEAGLSAGALGLIGFGTAQVSTTDFQNNACLKENTFGCSAVWVQGTKSSSIFCAQFENAYFKNNLMDGVPKDYIVSYDRVNIEFRGYTCFDINHEFVFSYVIEEASYDTDSISYGIENLEECRGDTPTIPMTDPSTSHSQPDPDPESSSPAESESPSSLESDSEPQSSLESDLESFPDSDSESVSQSSSDPIQEESELNIPALAGSLLGLLLLIIIIIIICCCCKKRCCPCCGCCKGCCGCFKACCCCCCRPCRCRRKKRKYQDSEIVVPMIGVVKGARHDDAFVIIHNPRCGCEDAQDSSDEDKKDDVHQAVL